MQVAEFSTDESVELWRRMNIFGRFRDVRVDCFGLGSTATDDELRSACLASGGSVVFEVAAAGETDADANARRGRLMSLLYEKALEESCGKTGGEVAYRGPPHKEKEKERRQRHGDMQAALHGHAQLRRPSVQGFLTEDLGNLPLSVALCGHMFRTDEALATIDDLIERFRAAGDLQEVDEKGANPQATY